MPAATLMPVVIRTLVATPIQTAAVKGKINNPV
ncbi:MAG: hypothetical protein K0R29_1653, partial [Pseudobdellovibrio sp.]|nr:hypothetical protein [Pseudobdellovibrio sp.]